MTFKSSRGEATAGVAGEMETNGVPTRTRRMCGVGFGRTTALVSELLDEILDRQAKGTLPIRVLAIGKPGCIKDLARRLVALANAQKRPARLCEDGVSVELGAETVIEFTQEAEILDFRENGA